MRTPERQSKWVNAAGSGGQGGQKGAGRGRAAATRRQQSAAGQQDDRARVGAAAGRNPSALSGSPQAGRNRATGVMVPTRHRRPLKPSQALQQSAGNRKPPPGQGQGQKPLGGAFKGQQCGDCSDSVASARSAQERPLTPLPSWRIHRITQ